MIIIGVFGIDRYLTAKREYCAACGDLLGSARYLILNPDTGKHESVHFTNACQSRYMDAHPAPALTDTSNRAPLPPDARGRGA